MRFLEKNQVVHRDLAARNCMIVRGTVKVGDFGLSMETSDGKLVEGDPHLRLADLTGNRHGVSIPKLCQY